MRRYEGVEGRRDRLRFPFLRCISHPGRRFVERVIVYLTFTSVPAPVLLLWRLEPDAQHLVEQSVRHRLQVLTVCRKWITRKIARSLDISRSSYLISLFVFIEFVFILS